MQTEFVQSKPKAGLLPYGQAQSLPKRKLTEDTCKKFGYTIGEYQGQPVQIANYRNAEGTVVAQKVRFADKTFKFLGMLRQLASTVSTSGKRVVVCWS